MREKRIQDLKCLQKPLFCLQIQPLHCSSLMKNNKFYRCFCLRQKSLMEKKQISTQSFLMPMHLSEPSSPVVRFSQISSIHQDKPLFSPKLQTTRFFISNPQQKSLKHVLDIEATSLALHLKEV